MDESERQVGDLNSHLMRFHDVDQLVAAYGGSQAMMRLGRHKGEGVITSANLLTLRFRAARISGAVRMQGTTPAGHAAVQIDLGSSSDRHHNGQLVGTGDIVAHLGRTDYDFVSASEHRGMTLILPDSVVLDALVQRMPAAGDMLRASRLYVAARCGPQIALIRQLSEEVFGLPGRLAGARAIEFALSAMVDAMVGAFLVPCHRSGREALRPAHYQRRPVVRRAEEFMRANLGNPIMLHDICRAARASERTVGYAFHDVYGFGAKQFLKLLRLNHARRELKVVPPEAATVEDIAHRNGLWHAGHFSTNYRRLFGETPQETRDRREADMRFVHSLR